MSEPKRMSDEEFQRLWSKLDRPFSGWFLEEKGDLLREASLSRAREKRLEERLAKVREMVGHILKRVDYREVIKSGGDWACAKCHPNSDMLVPGFECALHEAEGFLAEGAALSEET